MDSDRLTATYTDPALKHVLTVLDEDAKTEITFNNVQTYAARSLLDGAGQVLDQLKPLASSLESIGSNVARAAALFAEMQSILQPLKEEVSTYAREADYAHSESARLEREQQTLAAFADALHISSKQRNVLELGPLDDEFFEVLNHVRRVHAQGAEALLAEAPAAGELLMHESSKLLDIAYGRIKSGVEQQLLHGGTANLRRYMALLTERPLLFKSVLLNEESARKVRISREFASFVAQEQTSNSPTLMPVSYLSALLAWLHAAIVNEFEHVSLLFDDSTENKQLDELLNASSTRRVVAEFVDGVLLAIESGLRQRVTALAVAQTKLVVVDELQGILRFYNEMLTTQFSELKFLALLEQLSASIERQFEHLLDVQKLSYEQRVDTARQIVSNHEKSPDGRAVIESRLNLLLTNEQPVQSDHTADFLLSQLNRLDYAVTHLAGFASAEHALENLQSESSNYEQELAALECEKLLQLSGLEALAARELSLREFGIKLEKFLAEYDGGQTLEKLDSPTVARRVNAKAVELFLQRYEGVVQGSLPPADAVRSVLL